MQRLPLPVGSRHPVRRHGRVPRLAIGRGGRTLGITGGLVAAAAGALLGTIPPPVAVGIDAAGYHVGEVTLPLLSGGVYAGPEGAVVIDGRRSAGSTTLHGRPMTGSCELAPDGRGEHCAFTVGGYPIAADDRLDAGGWDRRYADGETVRITLAGGRPVMVPIAIGR